MISYDKGHEKRGRSSKHIGRYLDATTAFFLFVYLILVKRIVEIVTQGIGPFPIVRNERE